MTSHHRRFRILVFYFIALCLAGTAIWLVVPRSSDASDPIAMRHARMRLPMAFEPNYGQFADGERFLARARDSMSAYPPKVRVCISLATTACGRSLWRRMNRTAP